MSEYDVDAADLELPIKRTEGDTLAERLTDNAYHNILPARYLKKDADGELAESQEDLFERVGKNIALAEAVYEADDPVTVTPDQLKPDHPRRGELAGEVFGIDSREYTAPEQLPEAVSDAKPHLAKTEAELDEYNVNKFAFDTVVPELPGDVREHVESVADEFQGMMENLSFMPNSPTLMNAGDELQQLSACFVMSPDDDLTDIHETAKEAAEVFQSGGGCGYGFWQLRPYGDPVGSTGGIASGPITFMRTYDQLCETIAQGGARRGAQMGVMRVSHPDVIQFIHAKNKDVSLAETLRLNDPDDFTHNSFGEALEEARELITEDGKVPEHLRNAAEGHLSNFNISVGVTDDFMEAVRNGEKYTFTNPHTGEPHVATPQTKELYEMFDLGEHVEVGEELSVPADIIWERLVEGAHENGEPGVVFLDRINDEHSFPVESTPDGSGGKYEIKSTNPCGEQPLMEYEACNLGHINLSTIADLSAPDWRVWSAEHDFDTDEKAVEAFLEEALAWEEFDRRIEVGTRFLENVVTMSDFPVPDIEESVRNNRKIGLGVMGLAQLYIQLGVEYGSEVGDEIARQIMRHINHESKRTSHELAEQRRSFANWSDSKYADPTEYAEWFEKQTGLDAQEWADGFPIRNHNTTTIAPTGTTSMVGNTTGGCEPIYNVAYYKNVSDDVQGDEMLVEFDDYFLRVLEANGIDGDAVKEEAQEQMAANEFDGVDSLETVPDAIGELFVTTGDLTAKEHAALQCACQEGVDSAISKCIEEGTLVQTDQGLVRIEDFSDETPEAGEFVDVADDYTIDGVSVESQYYAGRKPSTEVRFDSGETLVGATESHRVMTPDGWQTLGELEPGDVVIGRHTESHGSGNAELEWSAREYDDCNAVELPATMTPKFARFLGMYAADGHLTEGTYRVGISTNAPAIRDEAAELIEDLFGVRPKLQEDERFENRDTVYDVVVNSKPIYDLVESLAGKGAHDKRVPEPVLVGNEAEKIAFLNGVTLDGYVTEQALVVYEGISEALAYGVAQLCRSFGVPHVYTGRKYVEESDEYAYGVHVAGEMQALLSPVEPHKDVETMAKRERVYVPEDLVDKTEFGSRSTAYYAARSFEHCDRTTMYDETAANLGIGDRPPAYEVTDVTDVGERELYDIELAGPHEYVVNGVISHNTVNAPNDATTEDAKEVFEYVYEHGGKGVTYYRDGTRAKQVLTTRAQNTEFAGDLAEMDSAEAAEVLVEQVYEVFGDLESFLEDEDVRAALDESVAELLAEADDARAVQPRPDVLRGVSQKIKTGYGKMYVTINEDPETGEPFEIFANIGHSGGFTNSFTEALGKACSTALRAGVDPEEMVDELCGTRSPKVAWDKGEQIQSIPDAIGTALRRHVEGEIDKAYPQQKSLDEVADSDAEGDGHGLPEPEPDGGAVAQQTQSDSQAVIDAGENPECPSCGAMSLYYSEGCKTCEACGWSEC